MDVPLIHTIWLLTLTLVITAFLAHGWINGPRHEQGANSSFDIKDDANVALLSPIMSEQQRIRIMELKLNAFINWSKDPTFANVPNSHCENQSRLIEFDPQHSGWYGHMVCLDSFSSPATDGKPCLVYDFGIREQPHFGQIMALHFGCEVHAFDPSPVSVDWFKLLPEGHILKRAANYHFHPYGAGGTDGVVRLYEYNWGQVSNIVYPQTLGCSQHRDGVHCNRTKVTQKSFTLPVKTLATIRAELGHLDRSIDVMKVDVEGSEYQFLYSMLDTYGCPDFIQQLTLEWHHFGIDERFGEGSNPHINVLATMLHACGLKSFWVRMLNGWTTRDKLFYDLGMHDMRYNLHSFHRA